MYASIKEWVNIPLVIKPLEKRDGTGQKIFGSPIEVLCYPVGETKLITNKYGAEIVSSTQLYVDGNTPVSDGDNVVFEGTELPIQTITSHYREGRKDIITIYL